MMRKSPKALQNAVASSHKSVSTSLQQLDRVLRGQSLDPTDEDTTTGGLPSGQITEIYGPPGVGKTILAGHRLEDLLEHSLHGGNEAMPDQRGQEAPVSSADVLDKFHHFMAPTLPHLMALLAHSTATFPPKGTVLLIVDSISTPFNQAFASSTKSHEERPMGKRNDAGHWASGRRWAVMADLISTLAKLAATRNIAVLLTSQTTTKMRLGDTALLQPALAGTAWDSGISSRILLYRDWQAKTTNELKEDHETAASNLRFAAVTKTGGVSFEGFGQIMSFAIERDGIREVEISSAALSIPEPVVPLDAVLKRKREEIADSASDSGDELTDDELSWLADGATGDNNPEVNLNEK
ncbi:MAG: hypothetical protein Q9215_004950 [Flavoplaca cf. flavocitrina]